MINNLPEDLQNLIYKAYYSDNVIKELKYDYKGGWPECWTPKSRLEYYRRYPERRPSKIPHYFPKIKI